MKKGREAEEEIANRKRRVMLPLGSLINGYLVELNYSCPLLRRAIGLDCPQHCHCYCRLAHRHHRLASSLRARRSRPSGRIRIARQGAGEGVGGGCLFRHGGGTADLQAATVLRKVKRHSIRPIRASGHVAVPGSCQVQVLGMGGDAGRRRGRAQLRRRPRLAFAGAMGSFLSGEHI
jgi:hypothetical protein